MDIKYDHKKVEENKYDFIYLHTQAYLSKIKKKY